MKIYYLIVGLLVFVGFTYGVAAPYLVSADNTELTIAGMFLVIMGLPIIVKVSHKIIDEIKIIMEEKDKINEDI